MISMRLARSVSKLIVICFILTPSLVYSHGGDGLDIVWGATEDIDWLVSEGVEGTSFTPISKNRNVWCSPLGAPLDDSTYTKEWSASKTKPWLTLSKTSGSFSCNAADLESGRVVGDTFKVIINDAAKTLAPGTYTDVITVELLLHIPVPCDLDPDYCGYIWHGTRTHENHIKLTVMPSGTIELFSPEVGGKISTASDFIGIKIDLSNATEDLTLEASDFEINVLDKDVSYLDFNGALFSPNWSTVYKANAGDCDFDVEKSNESIILRPRSGTVLEAGSTYISKCALSHHWDWIPQEIPRIDSSRFSWIPLIGDILDAKAKLDDFLSDPNSGGHPAAKEIQVNALLTNVTDKLMVYGHTTTYSVTITDNKLEQYNKFLDHEVALIGAEGTVKAFCGKAYQWAQIWCKEGRDDVERYKTFSAHSYKAAYDPPEEYIFLPIPVAPSSIDIPGDLVEPLKNLLLYKSKRLVWLDPANTAFERFHAASLANDKRWAGAQRAAFGFYMERLGALDTLIKDAGLAASEFLPKVTEEDLINTWTALREEGFSAPWAEALKAAGLSDSDIADRLDAYLAIDLDDYLKLKDFDEIVYYAEIARINETMATDAIKTIDGTHITSLQIEPSTIEQGNIEPSSFKVVIEFSDTTEPALIDLGTVLLNESVPAFAMEVSDSNGDGKPEAILSFEGSKVRALLLMGMNGIAVTGALGEDELFSGFSLLEVVSFDNDNDGIIDSDDMCLLTDNPLDTVEISGCDSGVQDVMLSGFPGCSIQDRILMLVDGKKNKGQFVREVNRFLLSLRKMGVIKWKEKGSISGCTGQSGFSNRWRIRALSRSFTH